MSDETKIELSKEEMAVISALEKLNIISINNVVKYMEQEYGISAAPVAMAAAPMAGGAAGAAAEEKSTFTLSLKSSGPEKIGVIKVVKEALNLGLKEAKDLVDANGVILENAPKDQVEDLKAKLEAAKAEVEVK